MATQTLLTLEQYLALPEYEADGTHYELSEGELISLPPPGFPHGVVVASVIYALRSALDLKKYIISRGDVGLLLKADPASATVRGADVAVHLRADVEPIRPGYQTVPPLVVIEVVSPGNAADDLELKVAQYLKAGVAEVWLLYPETRHLHFFGRSSHTFGIFEAGESFTSILGHEFAVSTFFEV